MAFEVSSFALCRTCPDCLPRWEVVYFSSDAWTDGYALHLPTDGSSGILLALR
jgi:hypothetical protein